jgi:hypothetical protein
MSASNRNKTYSLQACVFVNMSFKTNWCQKQRTKDVLLNHVFIEEWSTITMFWACNVLIKEVHCELIALPQLRNPDTKSSIACRTQYCCQLQMTSKSICIAHLQVSRRCSTSMYCVWCNFLSRSANKKLISPSYF